MRYEWDQRKNRENRRKHGVSFELASLVFEDEDCLIGKDRIDENGEERWHTLGTVSIQAGVSAVLLVVHVYREDRNGEEIIRIILARRASPDEYRRYQEQEVD
ncbi:MAG: BrnT family toxin [Terracidiphilus sp.]